MPPKNPRKRRLSPSRNKRKSGTKRFKAHRKVVKSKLFKNYRDQKQFQEIFSLIERVNKYGSSKDVNKHIAEYAVGSIEYCSNCKVDIHMLHADILFYEDDPEENEEIVGWKCCLTTNKYICKQCMKNITDICPRCSKLCGLCGVSECHVLGMVRCGGCKLRICDECVEGDISDDSFCFDCYWE